MPITCNLFGALHCPPLDPCCLFDEVSPRGMADGHVVRPIWIDCDVGRQGHALLVDGGPQVEVFDKGGNVDADLAEL